MYDNDNPLTQSYQSLGNFNNGYIEIIAVVILKT